MIFNGKTNEFFQLVDMNCNEGYTSDQKLESPLTFLWFQTDNNQVSIDGVPHTFNKDQIVCLTEFHAVDVGAVCSAKMIRFNRSFYCVIDHDSEVSCKGILFFGASELPVLNIPKTDLEKFELVWRMFEMEMESRDKLQLEMLQSMLKRFIILCTRLFKEQNNYNELDDVKVNLVREYNFLVEQHFKTKHTVAEYAELLFKSPKTLSNLFAKLSSKTPLQFIHDRKMLEAKRQLLHADHSIKEIAFEIGFEDVQSFGRFFKKNSGVSPTEFKENHV